MHTCYGCWAMILLRPLRQLRKQSQFDLSLAAKIPTYRLSLLENQKATPTPEELDRLAEALDVSPEDLTKEITEAALLSSS